MNRIRIFINNSCITLQQGSTQNWQGADFKQLVIDTFQENSERFYFFQDRSVDKLLDEFSSSFKVIEAAGGVVQNHSNQILFIHRLGKWDLPKGKIEKNESTETAAIREVEEECGINDLELKNFLDKTYHIYHHKDNWVLKVTHWYAMEHSGNQDLTPQTEEGINEVAWKNVDEISDLMDNSYKNIQLILSKALELIDFTL